MSIRKVGDTLFLKVAARAIHYPGESTQSINLTKGKPRGRGKPSLQICLQVAPWYVQNLMPNERLPLIEFIDGISPSFGWQGGYRFNAILDTGASRCAIRSSDILTAFGSTHDLNLSGLPDDTITLPNGEVLKGFRVWMYVQFVPARRPFLIPFFVSDRLQTPVIISWMAIRKMHRFVLSHDHLALCD